MKTLIAVLVGLISSNAFAAESLDLLMRARGLQALEKLEKLAQKNGDSRGKKLSKKDKCVWLLEGAYIAYGIPDTIKIVKKPLGKNLEAFNLYFTNRYEEKQTPVQLQYRVLAGNRYPEVFSVTQVDPEAASVSFMPKGSHIAILTFDDCRFLLNTNDPLDIIITD